MFGFSALQSQKYEFLDAKYDGIWAWILRLASNWDVINFKYD